MGFEIDFMQVGDGSRSGDAIALRCGNLFGARSEQTVVIIDGGTKESGQRLVDHVQNYYSTDYVDHVFSTHPDSDHASGLTVVLEKLRVGHLFMHQPWNHADEVRHMLERAYSTPALQTVLTRALSNVHDLQELAESKGIRVYEPFSDGIGFNGLFRILGPSKAYYQGLLCDFRDTPDAKQSLIAKAMSEARNAYYRVSEALGVETLDDSGVTPAENNSSVILRLDVDGHRILFTGDAGIPALTQAADLSDREGMGLGALRFLQVPHHGSRRNVGPSILNRIRAETAYISVCKDGAPKHPSQRVINALVRRGCRVYKTAGTNIWHQSEAPSRSGYNSIPPLPLIESFEDE